MYFNSTLDALEYYNNHCQKLLDEFQTEMKNLPEGSVICKKIKSYYRFYHNHQGRQNKDINPRYLPLSDIVLTKSLCRKRFVLDSIRDLKSCTKSINKFLKTFTYYDPTMIISQYPKPVANYCNATNVIPKSEFESDWISEAYKKNESYPENLVHWTASGLRVRSKSESIIATLLEKDKIPFRYEAALEIKDKTYYPDFTILRPRDKKIMFWEHFGMVDDESYRKSANQKLADYGEYDIFPWNQLITTFETKDSPIDARNVQRIINSFLLD